MIFTQAIPIMPAIFSLIRGLQKCHKHVKSFEINTPCLNFALY